MKPSMAQLARWSAYVLAVLCLGEAGMRIRERRDPELRQTLAVQRRLIDAWHRRPAAPFEPPVLTFADRGFDDAARMAWIADNGKLPPGRVWKAHDFLRPAGSPGSDYTVRSNALGFRDPERSVKKPRGVHRVICLGSYGTFGHGVEEEESLPRQLERLLGERVRGLRFEVWNAGRESSTAVVGLAMLRREIFSYHPDLIILDYGMVDVSLGSDDFLPVTKLLRLAVPQAYRLSAHSALFMAWISGRRNKAEVLLNRERLRQGLDLCAAEAERHGVPVILVDQAWSPDLSKYYEAVVRAHKNARYVGLQRVIERAAVPAAAREAFARGENWTTEFGADFHVHNEELFTDSLQLNKWGYRVEAEALAREIARQAQAEYSFR